MSNTPKKIKRLYKLFKRDCHCFYCHVATVLASKDNNRLKWFHATLEHLNTRWDIDKRWVPSDGKERTVLACYRCNIEQGKLRQSQVPIFIRKLKSGGGGIIDAIPDKNLDIKEMLIFLEKYAKEYRAKSEKYICDLIKETCLCNSDSECLTIIKNKIKQNIGKKELQEENYFLFQFLPKVNNREELKNILEKHIVELKHELLGNFIGNAVRFFKDQIINVDGNVIKSLILEMRI